MSQLRIGLAQTRQTPDRHDNRRAILDAFDRAAAQDIQVLCFPEAQTVGYRVDISPVDAPVPVDWLEEVHAEVAERCAKHGMACILGTETPLETDPKGGKPYNSALVISEHGEALGVHHKTRLTPLDALAYTPGRSFETFELFGVRVGVVICFEGLRFADREIARVLLSQEADRSRNPRRDDGDRTDERLGDDVGPPLHLGGQREKSAAGEDAKRFPSRELS